MLTNVLFLRYTSCVYTLNKQEIPSKAFCTFLQVRERKNVTLANVRCWRINNHTLYMNFVEFDSSLSLSLFLSVCKNDDDLHVYS